MTRTEQVFNPLGFYCASNSATPDYIVYDNFRMFVAYGLMCCWPSADPDDCNRDCNMVRPFTLNDVKELRKVFLDALQLSIVALWQGEIEPGDGGFDDNIIGRFSYNKWVYIDVENAEDADNTTSLTWDVYLNDNDIMMQLNCTGNDDEAIWLSYKGIEDRANVVKVLTDACRSIDEEVWPELLKESTK